MHISLKKILLVFLLNLGLATTALASDSSSERYRSFVSQLENSAPSSDQLVKITAEIDYWAEAAKKSATSRELSSQALYLSYAGTLAALRCRFVTNEKDLVRFSGESIALLEKSSALAKRFGNDKDKMSILFNRSKTYINFPKPLGKSKVAIEDAKASLALAQQSLPQKEQISFHELLVQSLWNDEQFDAARNELTSMKAVYKDAESLKTLKALEGLTKGK